MTTEALRTVAVLGASFGGNKAARVLAAGLPSGWRVVLVDRNSHFNHLYILPRLAVLPGHEHKAFIPYDRLFTNSSAAHPHTRVHGTITSLHSHHLVYTPHDKSSSSEEKTLHFDYAIYALGSHLPAPINLWESRDRFASPEVKELSAADVEKGVSQAQSYSGMKQEGVSWLRSRQQRIAAAQQVLVVGGGALGIQFASDIAAVYPDKSATLLHSRPRLLHRFGEAISEEAYDGLQELGVRVFLGERLDMSSLNVDGMNESGKQRTMLIKTLKGREIEADLVLLCTGQTPNTSLLSALDSRTIDPESGMVRVSRTMQILAQEEKDSGVDTTVYPHLFAIGDAADAFGAIKAGHTAHFQGEVAARNVIRLIKAENARTLGVEATLQKLSLDTNQVPAVDDDAKDLELEQYQPGPPKIKVSLGLTKATYEVAGTAGVKNDGVDDLRAASMWGALGFVDVDEEQMHM